MTKMTLKEMKEQAAKMNIKGYSKMNKTALAEAIEAAVKTVDYVVTTAEATEAPVEAAVEEVKADIKAEKAAEVAEAAEAAEEAVKAAEVKAAEEAAEEKMWKLLKERGEHARNHKYLRLTEADFAGSEVNQYNAYIKAVGGLCDVVYSIRFTNGLRYGKPVNEENVTQCLKRICSLLQLSEKHTAAVIAAYGNGSMTEVATYSRKKTQVSLHNERMKKKEIDVTMEKNPVDEEGERRKAAEIARLEAEYEEVKASAKFHEERYQSKGEKYVPIFEDWLACSITGTKWAKEVVTNVQKKAEGQMRRFIGKALKYNVPEAEIAPFAMACDIKGLKELANNAEKKHNEAVEAAAKAAAEAKEEAAA